MSKPLPVHKRKRGPQSSVFVITPAELEERRRIEAAREIPGELTWASKREPALTDDHWERLRRYFLEF